MFGLARKAGLGPMEWLGILPAIAALVGDVVKALGAASDGGKKVTAKELEQIGADLVAIVQAVTGK